MKKLTQAEFEALISLQKSDGVADVDLDIRDVELSGIDSPQDWDAVTIAMSSLSHISFGTMHSLQGMTWIGNEIQHCTFIDTPMNKSELLDCVFEDCTWQHVSLFRADWSGSVFKHCTFRDLNLSATCLIQTSLVDCVFMNVTVDSQPLVDGKHTLRFDATGQLQFDS